MITNEIREIIEKAVRVMELPNYGIYMTLSNNALSITIIEKDKEIYEQTISLNDPKNAIDVDTTLCVIDEILFDYEVNHG